VGGGVSAPKVLYSVDPELTKEAKEKGVQGLVALRALINENGQVGDICVERGLGYGLTEKAIEAVRQWKFKPAEKDGKPVPVKVSVEVNFHE
jgi:TonB family protein